MRIPKFISRSFFLMLLTGVTVSAMKWAEVGPFEKEEVIPFDQLPVKYLDMDPLLIPLIQEGGVAAVVQMTLKLETRGEENAAELARQMPRLKDALFRDMYGFLPRLLKDREELDVYILKKRLMLTAAQTVRPGKIVSDILIQSLTDQPGN